MVSSYWSASTKVVLTKAPPAPRGVSHPLILTGTHFFISSHVLLLRTMAGGSRSRLGCWTCRLRRKKCDERRPSCASCEGLGIDCHGYGQRPEWMDGCEKEKEAAANTRRAIKNAARREPGPAPSTGDRSASNAPSSSHESPDHSATGPSEDHLQTVGLHGPQNEKDSSVYETTRLAQSLPIAKTEPVFASGSSSTPWAEKGNINQLDRASSSSESPGHVDYDLTQALKGREASLLMCMLFSCSPSLPCLKFPLLQFPLLLSEQMLPSFLR